MTAGKFASQQKYAGRGDGSPAWYPSGSFNRNMRTPQGMSAGSGVENTAKLFDPACDFYRYSALS